MPEMTLSLLTTLEMTLSTGSVFQSVGTNPVSRLLSIETDLVDPPRR